MYRCFGLNNTSSSRWTSIDWRGDRSSVFKVGVPTTAQIRKALVSMLKRVYVLTWLTRKRIGDGPGCVQPRVGYGYWQGCVRKEERGPGTVILPSRPDSLVFSESSFGLKKGANRKNHKDGRAIKGADDLGTLRNYTRLIYLIYLEATRLFIRLHS